jgi:hypothetical protein
MECRLAGETEVLGENLPQRHFCPSQNPTRPDPVLNPGRHGRKPATNRLSYGAALPLPLPFYPYDMDAIKLEAGATVLSQNILHTLNKFIYWHELITNNTCDKFN